MIKAIIFDFGNVICTFDNNIFLDKIAPYSTKSRQELERIIYHESGLPKKYETGKISSDQFYTQISQLCDLDMPRIRFIEAYTQIFTPIKSTFDLIKNLNKNYKLAILSNTSEWDHQYGIKPTEIYDLFEVVSLSFEIKAMKPDPAIFYDCLDKLRLRPEECIYIDDIQEYVDVANSIGMQGIRYISYEELLISLKDMGVSFRT